MTLLSIMEVVLNGTCQEYRILPAYVHLLKQRNAGYLVSDGSRACPARPSLPAVTDS